MFLMTAVQYTSVHCELILVMEGYGSILSGKEVRPIYLMDWAPLEVRFV